MKRFEEAEPLLVEGYPVLKEESDSPRPAQSALERIIDLYESWHAAKPNDGYGTKATEWRAKLAELEKQSEGGGE